MEFGLELNEQQARAAETVNGRVLLLAVPGSGKTTVLVARLFHMLTDCGVKPHKVLTITFSKRSAADMARRYAHYFPDAPQPRFSTIHSFCYGVVKHISTQYRRPLPRVVQDPSELVRGLFCALEEVRFVERETLDEVVAAIGFCKNRLADDDQTDEVEIEGCNFGRLFRAYKAHMSENHLMDYDDMLVFTYDMFRKNPAFLAQYHALYSHVCVDEAQDTSLVQHKIIAQLAEKSGNLFMVGDEDQSIYGFRGAFPEALLSFDKDYPDAMVLKMEQNYRSTGEIVRAANRLIGQNRSRIEKKMHTTKETGTAVTVHEVRTPSTQYDEALALLGAYKGSRAVLYRGNDSAAPLADALERAGVAFSLRDTREAFFRTVQVRDMTDFLRLSLDPTDVEAFCRIYGKTSAYFSRAVLDFARDRHTDGEDIYKTLRKCPSVEDGRLETLRVQISKLGKLKPVNALNLLENCMKRGYFNSESAARRLMLLKSIAAREETVVGFLARLETLCEIMKKAPASDASAVSLSTIHSSKGLEYDCVLLVDMIDGQFPPKSCTDLLAKGDRAAYEEEVRLCYVAATRARDELHIITFAEGNRTCRPSRFVRLLTTDAPPPSKTATDKKPKKSPAILKTPPEGYAAVTDAAQLMVGMSVLHDNFGVGRALRIENGCIVWFDGVMTRRFFIKTCIDNQNFYLRTDAQPS